MPLSVKDGMGAWIKDFQKSDAPQFKGKSDKERREMAMAAYLDAKRGDKNEGYVSAAQRKAVHATRADGGKGHPDNKKEEVKPPFTPDPPSKNKPRTNSDGTKTSPMSRAKQLAKMARDRGVKKESVELEEMYASTTEPHKSGHRPKVVKTQPNGKTTMSYLGQHVYKSKEHARNAADHIAKGMRKGRASDSYIDDFARRHHKEHGMKESVEENFNWKVSHAGKDVHVKAPHAGAAVKKAQKGFGNIDLTKAKISNLGKVGAPTKEETQIDELDTKTYASYSDKAGKQLMGRGLSPDKRSLRALGRATADMKKYGDKRTLRQRIRQDMNKESVELGEAFDKEKFQSAEAELVKYAKAHGGMDKRDFLEVAKMLGQIGRINILQAGQILARLNRKLSNMDTDPRDKVYSILKQKKLMESVEEAKDFDKSFKNHLKFATSKSPAVQAYMKKRKADRDAAHAKQDPAAVKKNYGPAVVPPGTAYNKARKKGMNPSAAADAVSGAFKNKAKRDRKLPK